MAPRRCQACRLPLASCQGMCGWGNYNPCGMSAAVVPSTPAEPSTSSTPSSTSSSSLSLVVQSMREALLMIMMHDYDHDACKSNVMQRLSIMTCASIEIVLAYLIHHASTLCPFAGDWLAMQALEEAVARWSNHARCSCHSFTAVVRSRKGRPDLPITPRSTTSTITNTTITTPTIFTPTIPALLPSRPPPSP